MHFTNSGAIVTKNLEIADKIISRTVVIFPSTELIVAKVTVVTPTEFVNISLRSILDVTLSVIRLWSYKCLRYLRCYLGVCKELFLPFPDSHESRLRGRVTTCHSNTPCCTTVYWIGESDSFLIRRRIKYKRQTFMNSALVKVRK